MPFTNTFTKTLTIDGVPYTQTSSGTSNGKEHASVSVPAAKVGTLTTRTDANTGVLTMVTGHGVTTGNKVDVFWNGGSRRNMTATVATNAVTVDGGSGNDLPVVDTAITAMVPTEMAFTVDGDQVDGFVARCPVSGWVVFREADDTEIAAAVYQILPNLGGSKVWSSDSNESNPLEGVVTGSVLFSHGDSTQAHVMEAVATY